MKWWFQFVLLFTFLLFNAATRVIAHSETHIDTFNNGVITSAALNKENFSNYLICNPSTNSNGTIPKSIRKFKTIYIYHSVDKFDEFKPKIKEIVGIADNVLNRNAILYKKNLHFNFEVDENCNLIVTKVNSNFADLNKNLEKIFGNIEHQKILVIKQTEEGITDCGVYSGAMNGDTEDEGGFAIVYTQCLTERVVLHELLHSQGAVQFNAPDTDFTYHVKNTTGDVMSYNVGLGCKETTENTYLLFYRLLVDCNQTNYLNFNGDKINAKNIYYSSWLNHDKANVFNIYLSIVLN